MRNKYLPLLGLAFAGLSSCFNDKAKTPRADIWSDTLTYQYLNVKSKADDCGNKPDSSCTTAEFKYPKFDGQPLLNDSIMVNVATHFDRAKGAAGLQRLTWYYLEDYKAYKKNNPDWKGKFELTTQANIVVQDSSLLGVEFSGYEYMGGAHGTSRTTYFNWNTQARKKITLADILKPDYQTTLTTAAEKIFRKQENLTPTASLNNDYFFANGKFSLNSNFLITPIGLKFFYNRGEIKPNAADVTIVEIPYEQIKTIIQPNTVLARYTK